MMRTVTENSSSHNNGVSFLFSDFHLQRREVEGMIRNIQTPILAAGDAIAEPGVVHLFDSQEAFDQWASRTRFAKKFEEANEFVRRTRTGLTTEFSDQSVRLVSNTNIETNWEILSPTLRSDSLESSVTFFDGREFTGRSFTTGPAGISDLNDIEFFQSAASINVRGLCLLTDRVLFGGARLYLVGDPRLDIIDLQTWGFNNCAASALIL